MVRVRISDEGGIALPQELVERLGWVEGTELEVESRDGLVMIYPVRPFPPTTIEEVRGCLPYDGPPVSIEEMDAGVMHAAREMWEEFERQPR